MTNTFKILLFGALLFAFLGLAACAPPSGLPEGPTPIPTLIPATEIPSAVEPTTMPSFAVLSYPAQLPSAIEGQSYYTDLCAQCHGEDGTGIVPGSRDFRDLDYMRGETLANFYIAVTEGREDMPAYKDDLSSDERWDVVYYVWRLSTEAETIKTGKELYDRDCASCHGEDGSGELLGSADFTDLRQMDQLAPRDLYLTLTQGRGSMPGWQSLLSQEERWAIIDYLLTFTYDPSLPQEVSLDADAEATPPGEDTAVASCSTEQTNPYAWDDAQAIQAGQSIYELQCALCHGPDGAGGLPNTPDFTSEEVSLDLRAQPGQYLCAIAEGVGAMPAFGTTLSAEEQWQLLTYMGSVGP